MHSKRAAVGVVSGRVAVFAALIALTAGCNSSPSSSGVGAPTTAPAGTATSSAGTIVLPAGAATGAGSGSGFVSIVEPWDPGHPARSTTQTVPADCRSAPSTVEIEQCFESKAENTDAEIDAAQQARYASASASEQASILAQDSAWLTARQPVCNAAFNSAGSIDGINIGACLLDESTARLDAIKGITPDEAMLKSTDGVSDPGSWDWYTTPEGSRIAELATQGDRTGGGIEAWVIIGGADGFVINPSQFFFTDGSFTDPGVIQMPDPTSHRVGTGEQYQFSIDFTHLSAAPTGNPAKGFVYAPGSPVAIWQ